MTDDAATGMRIPIGHYELRCQICQGRNEQMGNQKEMLSILMACGEGKLKNLKFISKNISYYSLNDV